MFTQRVAMIRGVDHDGGIHIGHRVEHGAEMAIGFFDQLQIVAAISEPVFRREIARLPALIFVHVLLLFGGLTGEVAEPARRRLHALARLCGFQNLRDGIDIVRIENGDPGQPRRTLLPDPAGGLARHSRVRPFGADGGEAERLSFAAQMPLAEVSGAVSRGVSNAADVRNAGRERLAERVSIDVGEDVSLVRLEPGEQARSRRRALGRVAEGGREAHGIALDAPPVRQIGRAG